MVTDRLAAFLVFRNPNGSLTPVGVYWIALTASVLAVALFNMLVPGVAVRLTHLSSVEHGAVLVRLVSGITAAAAIWLGMMAITAVPGQPT